MFLYLCLSAPAVWLAMHWWAMADLFLSHGDSYSDLDNLSTLLTRFPLVSHYQTMPLPQILHYLCEVPQTNQHFAIVPFSLEPRQATMGRKTQHKLSSLTINSIFGHSN